GRLRVEHPWLLSALKAAVCHGWQESVDVQEPGPGSDVDFAVGHGRRHELSGFAHPVSHGILLAVPDLLQIGGIVVPQDAMVTTRVLAGTDDGIAEGPEYARTWRATVC